MPASAAPPATRTEGWTDEEVIARVLAGETALYEIIMRRYNQRLYRIARAILRDDAEAEDVMQDAYVRAYEHLSQFRGQSTFSAWLTRIAVNEALTRRKRRGRYLEMESMPQHTQENLAVAPSAASPEQQASTRELSALLEEAILGLPDTYRPVLVLRDIEELSTLDTAAALELSEENVKIRLHRARAILRRELFARAGATRGSAFTFLGPRCDRVVKRTLETILRERAAN